MELPRNLHRLMNQLNNFCNFRGPLYLPHDLGYQLVWDDTLVGLWIIPVNHYVVKIPIFLKFSTKSR